MSPRFDLPTSDRVTLADAIAEAKFVPVRFRNGYDQDAVDSFLDGLEELVRKDTPADEIKDAVEEALFPTTKIKEGYDVDDVDDFLDEVIDAVLAIAPSAVDLLASYYATVPGTTALTSSYDFSAPAPPVPPLAEAIEEKKSGSAGSGAYPTRRELRAQRRKAAEEAARAAEALRSEAGGS